MRIPLPKALPLGHARARLTAQFRQFPIPPIIRRHPGRSAGIASATVVGGALLVLVLQAYSPGPSGIESSAGTAEASAAEPAGIEIGDLEAGQSAVAATTGMPAVEKGRLLAVPDRARAAPDTERWADAVGSTVRRVDQEISERRDLPDDVEAQAVVLEHAPDHTVTAAIEPNMDPDGAPDGGQVAIAESEVEVAALETRMADRDSEVFSSAEELTEQPDAVGQGIVTSYVNMRAGPENDAEILKVLPESAAVSILDHCPNWCQVEHEGTRGFVYGSFVERAAETGLSALETDRQ